VSATLRLSPAARRSAYALAATVLLAAIAFELAAHSTGWWQLAAFVLAPDLALLVGAGEGLERGQLHSRAVPVYNAVHRFYGPIGLAALVAFGVLPLGFFVGALAWGFHVALDRALGYGLRTHDGFQRR
jgi:L-alanine-DL-glutamate epimerase-like enolase superfamily enzyme